MSEDRLGIVYVMEHDNGEVKVGRTSQIAQRLDTLKMMNRAWGVRVRRCWSSGEISNSVQAEKQALSAVSAFAGSPVRGKETFRATYAATVACVADSLGVGTGEEIPVRRHVTFVGIDSEGKEFSEKRTLGGDDDVIPITLDGHRKLATARLSTTDFSVLYFLLGEANNEGRVEVEMKAIAEGTGYSISGVTVALRRIRDLGGIFDRVDRSGFQFDRRFLLAQR